MVEEAEHGSCLQQRKDGCQAGEGEGGEVGGGEAESSSSWSEKY